MNLSIAAPLQNVVSRPLKARAMQFVYFDDASETRKRAERIATWLNIDLDSSYDPQSGCAYFLRDQDGITLRMLRSLDWIVKDSFEKVSVVSDKDFKVYYEPQ